MRPRPGARRPAATLVQLGLGRRLLIAAAPVAVLWLLVRWALG